MNPNVRLAFAGLFLAFAATAFSQPALTFAEAQEHVRAARRYVAHPAPADKKGEPRVEAPVKTPDFEIAVPPPPARPEPPAPLSPVAGHVWVAGHHMPVKGEWRWVRGEWAEPATPSSVWIPARYDAKEKKWTPGYWQPDRPYELESEAPAKVGAPTVAPKY